MDSDTFKRSSPPPPSYETAMGLSHPPPHNPYYPSLANESLPQVAPLPMPMPRKCHCFFLILNGY